MKVSAYGNLLTALAEKKVDLSSDSLKVLLTTSSYTPDQDAHKYKSDVTNEVTGDGYTAGGQALTNVTLTYADATNTLTLDADDVSWDNSTITARYAVLYDDTPTSSKPLIALFDFENDVSSSSGPFKLNWNASGILDLSTADPA